MSARRVAVVALLLALAGTAGAQAKRRPAPKAKPSVLFITIDTLRADHLGCYGYQQIQTPAIDGLCRDAIVFDRAIAQVPLTWPSHVAMLTGTYPFWNGVQDFTGQPLRPDVGTLAEAMKRHGYATGAVVSSFVLDRSFGIARGFDFYYDQFQGSTFLEKDIGLVDRRAGPSVDEALRWMKTARKPFFLWLHLYDPHSPYDPPEPFRSRYSARPYDGEIAYADSQLARVFAWLKQAGLYDTTLIILASDHGESLGEHGEKEHGFFVYQSTVHVPLVVKPPRASGLKPRHETAAVETVAIPATVLDLLGIRDPITKQFQAAGLLQPTGTPAYSETFYPFSSFGWNPLHSLVSDRYQYISAPRPELYDLGADPKEEKSLAAERPAVTAALQQGLDSRLQKYAAKPAAAGGGSVDADAASKLRALGYLAYRAPVSAEQLKKGLADPKDKLAEFNAILEATDALRAGDVDQGKAWLEQVRAQDPQMYLVPFLLGEAALRRGDAQGAIEELRKALQLNPDFDQAMTGLARALHLTGADDEARQWLEKALKDNPQNYRAWYQLAWTELEHDPAKATAALKQTLAIQPNFAFAHRDLGVLAVRAQDYPAAVEHLERAAKLGLEEAPLFNFLGIAYVHTGKIRQGIENYRRALKLDPNLAQAHLNLGAALYRNGMTAEGREEYQAACRLQSDYCQFVPQP